MNPTLYTQLAPLGFAEWLGDKISTLIYLSDWLKAQDEEPIESIGRTQLNALAFRWLREEKKIFAYVIPFKDHSSDNNDPVEYKTRVVSPFKYYHKIYDTHSLAEHEALNKALEILSKGGENE